MNNSANNIEMFLFHKFIYCSVISFFFLLYLQIYYNLLNVSTFLGIILNSLYANSYLLLIFVHQKITEFINIMSTLTIAIIVVFVLGYALIAMESLTKVNKAAIALLMFVFCLIQLRLYS